MLHLRSDRWLAWLFVAPAMGLIGLFVLLPVASMLGLSFSDATLTLRERPEWVGLRNYADLARDVGFRHALRNTALFAVLITPAQTALALLLALACDGRGADRRLLRLCVFVPTTLSLAVLSVVWKLLYAPLTAEGGGLINGLLASLGLPPQPFLTSPAQALYAIAAMSVWQGVGLQMAIFLAGLQQVPRVLHEAAALDGAGRWMRLRHVTLPALAPTVVFVVLITSVLAFKLFVQPYVMTAGGPQDATRSLVQHIYEAAFRQRSLGLASAAGVVFLMLVLGLTLLLRRRMQPYEQGAVA